MYALCHEWNCIEAQNSEKKIIALSITHRAKKGQLDRALKVTFIKLHFVYIDRRHRCILCQLKLSHTRKMQFGTEGTDTDLMERLCILLNRTYIGAIFY